MGLTVHGDLPLLHGLQEGGLGAGGGPVQLVRQEQVTQHRPRLIGHGPGLLIVNGVSGYVRRQNVRCKLNPPIGQAQRPGEGQSQRGLAHARNIFQEDVAPGQDGSQAP